MGWFNGAVFYVMIWWITLFAVLPFGARPAADPDPAAGGWRGTPTNPRLLRKAAVTTLVAGLVWLICLGIAESGWVSFRDGWFALPS